MAFQSSCSSSPVMCLVTLLSTSMKSYSPSAGRHQHRSGPANFHTATKKLDVPSARSKKPGNNLSQVSSPYINNFPVCFAFICANHVSWEASDDDSSPSSMFRMTSRKDGMDPVVMALILGMVTVGDVACAVKGIAEPSRINLSRVSVQAEPLGGFAGLQLTTG